MIYKFNITDIPDLAEVGELTLRLNGLMRISAQYMTDWQR